VVYAEGQDERVLRAVQFVADEGLAAPILVGQPAAIEAGIKKAGLRIKIGQNVQVIDPASDARVAQYAARYKDGSEADVRASASLLAALMVKAGDADAMLCGLDGNYDGHLAHVEKVIGLKDGAQEFAALNAVLLPEQTLFITDTYVNDTPDAEQLARIAKAAAEEVARFGVPPKVAFLSHSNGGSSSRPSARKMAAAHDAFKKLAPEVESAGELHGDAALSEKIRHNAGLTDSALTGAANVLVCPNLDAANILFNVLKTSSGQGTTIGPILLGAAAPVHVLTPSSTVRRVINMTALAAAKAQDGKSKA
jgi:malate dehydrogenase (oxaloacetate-decarboxylating)(NADP+)